MIWIIIAVIIALFVTIYFWRRNGIGSGLGWGAGIGSIGITVAWLLGIISYAVLCTTAETVPCKISEQNIYAIQDNSLVEGKISSRPFVKRMYINEIEYYHYICDGTYGKKTEKVPVNKTFLIETKENFHIEIWRERFKHQWIRIFTEFGVDYLDCAGSGVYYKIYVPYGTITTDYNIDLQY